MAGDTAGRDPGVEPAAFVTEPRVTFTVPTGFAALLQEPGDPPTGFVMNAAPLDGDSAEPPLERATP